MRQPQLEKEETMRSSRLQTGKNPNGLSGPAPCLWAEFFQNQTDENLPYFSRSPGEETPPPSLAVLEQASQLTFRKFFLLADHNFSYCHSAFTGKAAWATLGHFGPLASLSRRNDCVPCLPMGSHHIPREGKACT